MIKVGITGGIGSGKSTVCHVFSIMGIPVFETDKVARQLMNHSPELRTKLIQLFGKSVYLDDQNINRKYLAAIVFNSPESLEQLNSIVHPAVRNSFLEWSENQTAAYVINEAAIMFETGLNQLMDKTIVIATDEKERIQRVMKRDEITEEQVLQRIRNQWPDEQKIKLADFVIYNNDDQLIIPQIVEIDRKIRIYGEVCKMD
jgi:dephospho-CoA kinase